MTSLRGTCVVVGASSGIGASIARRLGLEGRKVAMLARRPREVQAMAAAIDDALGRKTAFPYVHDAADLDAVEGLFAQIEQELGEIDEVHYVAGVMPEVAIDEFDLKKDRMQMQVNALGCIAWCNAAAKRFCSASAAASSASARWRRTVAAVVVLATTRARPRWTRSSKDCAIASGGTACR